ncbi:MAG: hypothetical protein A2X40_11095 [Elusimicrobia bacterium GWC2_65_9]|nr:MAG: hypothetical protein A2X40_11095 [Elusimicrobia bacterium GWC2_65_9]
MTAPAPFESVVDAFLEAASRLAVRPAVVRGGRTGTFADLAEDVLSLAEALLAAGLRPGERAAVLLPPSEDFYALTFALLRAGIVPVFIDPGIGFENMGRCLAETAPAAFIGSPKAHLARWAGRWAPAARLSLVADGWLPGVSRLRRLRGSARLRATSREDVAAILFTSGSTGAPKGAVYTHGMFAAQLESLRRLFDIQEGEVSVPTFPLFGLFDVALGQTCVLPHMDFTRPGFVDPPSLIDLLQKSRACQLFGSPALLDRVGRFGAGRGVVLPALRRVLSAGAPMPVKVLERFQRMLSPGVEIQTAYGATEALPVALIGSAEALGETVVETAQGRGICVGRPVPGVEVSVIRIVDGAIAAWSDSLRACRGEVGEIVVKGPMVSRDYFRREEAAALAKIPDGAAVRHRMGDLGHIDDQGRLWFCGRKSQRVRTQEGDLYTLPVEGVFNAHPDVKRTALVGVGREPVLCVEKEPGTKSTKEELTKELLALGARHEHTRRVKTVLFHPSFPVDIRHNAKIVREKLAVWAAQRLA